MMPSRNETAREESPGRFGVPRAYRRIVLVVAVALALAAGYPVLTDKGDLMRFLEWVQAQGALGMLFLGVAYVLACLLLVPGTILSFAAGFLFGVGWGSVTVSVGSTLGACAAFLAGRALAREWVAEKMGANERFVAISQAVARRGITVVMLARLTPVLPFNLLNYAFGLTSIRFTHYAFASWIGMLPATVAIVYLGSGARSLAAVAAGDVEGGRVTGFLFWLGLAATLAIAALAAAIARRALRPLFDPNQDAVPAVDMRAEAP
jgi:uncharacterized membrane protein YdjX (TVP38/TMEM64 family)